MSNDCAQLQTRTREMAQHREQLQTQCPGEDCPCQDQQGTACQEFQHQVQNTVQEMNQLAFQTRCDEGGCDCDCANGGELLQFREQLQETILQEEQLQTRCQTGDCVVEDEVFFDSLSTALTGLERILKDIGIDFHAYLPLLSNQGE